MSLNRQRQYQERHIKQGLCALCNEKLASKRYCAKHTIDMRENTRAYYRAKNGIPLDAPLIKSGRPRRMK